MALKFYRGPYFATPMFVDTFNTVIVWTQKFNYWIGSANSEWTGLLSTGTGSRLRGCNAGPRRKEIRPATLRWQSN